MANQKGSTQKKERITEQMITDIMRLRRQGFSISAIARTVGCHRQTVSAHLKERREDFIAEEARKQVLTQALANHFEQLARFAQVELKLMLDASMPVTPKKRREPRPIGPIVTNGLLGLPHAGWPTFIAREWARMYNPPPRESHLLLALREHTRETPVWVHWDNWRKQVADYEKASRVIWDWLEENLEGKPPENTAPGEIDAIRDWLFGNILLAAGGRETIGPEAMTGITEENRGTMYTVKSGESPLTQYLATVIKEIRNRPEWDQLASATALLQSQSSQSELRRTARDTDQALVAIVLMHAFPGRCQLCPA